MLDEYMAKLAGYPFISGTPSHTATNNILQGLPLFVISTPQTETHWDSRYKGLQEHSLLFPCCMH